MAVVLMIVSSAMAGKKPNILFIMSDDHTAQAIGAYHSRLAYLNPTPNIDRLAARGMVLENAFNGVLTLNDRLPKERQYLPVEMKKAGYQTAIVGKWHLKELPATYDYYKVLPGQGTYFDPFFYESGHGKKRVRMKGHSTDCIMDAALDWFKHRRDPNKPFLFNLHFKAPHDYFEYAPRYEHYLEDVSIPEPLSLWKRGNGSLATRGDGGELSRVIATSIGRRNFRRSYAADWGVDPALDDKAAKRTAYNIYLKKYLRCVKGIDDNLGRLFQYLEKEHLIKNTLIVYTADQGLYLGENDMQDKRWGYDCSMRMPLIVSYPPAIPAGSRSDALIENIDFPVTLLDYAGVPRPNYMQGRSFRKVLETGQEPVGWKQEVYYQYWMHMAHHDVPGHIAMRTKRYKLILFDGTAGTSGFGSERSKYRTPPAWELYDLLNDPNELNNVYDDPAYASVVAELKSRFKALRHRIYADDPSVAPTPEVRDRVAAVNKVIDEYWDYSPEDREKAIRISHDYFKRFGDPTKCKKYLPPWMRPNHLDPSEK